MKDNKGFSLIELIITIAIIGVIVTVGVRRMDTVSGYSAREAISKVESAINATRVSCMSKSKEAVESIYVSGSLNPDLNVYLEIYEKSNGMHYVKLHEGAKAVETKLGPRKISVTYTFTGDATRRSVGSEGNGLFLSFDRSTGGFIPQDAAGTSVEYIYCSTSKKDRMVHLMPTTGKVTKD